MKPSIASLSLCTVAAVLCSTVSTFAQQPTERERQLEDLVRKLSAKVEQLEARLDKLEDAGGNRATQARVAQLEQNVEQIKKERPPAPDSQDGRASANGRRMICRYDLIGRMDCGSTRWMARSS